MSEKNQEQTSEKNMQTDIQNLLNSSNFTKNIQENYIIIMNNSLRNENKDFILQIKDLENNIENLENGNDSLEKTITNMKGLVKNFHEMNKLYTTINKHNYFIISETRKYILKYKNTIQRFIYCLSVIITFIIPVLYDKILFYNMFFIYFYLFIFLIIYVNYYILNKINIHKFHSREENIKKIMLEIKKTNDAQDYIYDFIDSQ